MSINGIGNTYGNPALTPKLGDPGSVDESARKAIRPPEHNTGDVKGAQPPGVPVPAEAPPGTDPALWSVLTSSERLFFSINPPAGPLTYGPAKNGPISPAGPSGGRIDLKA